MECERCGNTSRRYFVQYRGKTVCRRCIGFTGDDATIELNVKPVEVFLPFHLTPTQKTASLSIREAVAHSDVLVNAVCGAGKTELVFDTIAMFLMQSRTIGLAIARRQVVLQLAGRLAASFPDIKVQAICEGQTSILNAQLFVVTTHQLYRFHQAFDCLILDEPDAFPFAGDPLLEGFAKQACRGRIIYLSATPDKGLLDKVKKGTMVEVRVNRRPHGQDLPVANIVCVPRFVQYFMLLLWLKRIEGRKLVFVPTIRRAKQLSRILRIPFVCASSPNLTESIGVFSQNENGTLITTTVLERGVTFVNAQVCVLVADHKVFTTSSLIQIAGRVGRSPEFPSGEVLFLCSKRTRELRNCLKTLKRANDAV